MSIQYQFKADADTVFAKLTNADFLKSRCESLGEIKVDCQVSETDGKVKVMLDRTIRRDLPKVLAKMFNPENRTVMHEIWQKLDDGSYRGEYEIDVKGQPVNLFASFTLKNKGKGSVYDIDHGCRAKIPLVGRQVEKFVIGQIGDGFRKEMDFVANNLD